MTPEERADAIRQLGFREPIGSQNWRLFWGFVVGAFTVLGFGLFALVFGDDAGFRLRGAVGVAVGIPAVVWCWRILIRPVAPDDRELEREFRHRFPDSA